MPSVSEHLTTIPEIGWFQAGAYQPLFEAGLQDLAEVQAPRRISSRDGSLWAGGARADAIEARLGWLDLPTDMMVEVVRLRALAMEMQAAEIRHVILLGMGGSSLAAEVFANALASPEGYPLLTVLDSTDPTEIRAAEARAPLAHTLLLVSSKSGSTAEVESLYAHFRQALEDEVGAANAPRHAIVITDPGTPLEQMAIEQGLRNLYLNPPDVGGRYSALSFFGLVPAALVGVNLDALLQGARDMALACREAVPIRENPGLILGAFLGELARPFGGRTLPLRDKLTLVASPPLLPLLPWIEQLVAESTGKHGVGILPVEAESLVDPAAYGDDRVLAYLRLDGVDNAATDSLVATLADAGHPVAALRVPSVQALGAEMFRWEYATAVAGQRLGINPFDQPDVEAAKDQARQALERYARERHLAEEEPVCAQSPLTLYGEGRVGQDIGAILEHFLAQAAPDDYVALLAYVCRCPAHDAVLCRMRQALASRLGRAVTRGFGPRYLHSTGQLHKGGRNNGLFLLITHDEANDLPVPGRSYSFGVLKMAQALGDLAALRAAGRRVLRIHLEADVAAGLEALASALGC